MPLGISIARPLWSFCPQCKCEIRWYDNLPVVSWLLLRGRCRACKCAISAQYPVVEALTGAVFVAIFHLLF
ncbi:MAG: prepilin peptidase, partial [Phycisphaerae bacterium]